MTRPVLSIAFLVDTLQADYQRNIFAGARQEAVRLNVSVHALVGGAIALSGPSVHQNRIYDCVSPARFDGLVILATTLGTQLTPDAAREYLDGFSRLPRCTVGVRLPGIASVNIDNEAGARQALIHLIEDAGRRRIAFIRGPQNNQEADTRYRVYRTVLQEYHIPFDPDMVTIGDYLAHSGAQAISTLIDERHVGFDAIMAASDLMALGAMNALRERGVDVPKRVSVVGFDDIEAARYAAAPLTTVRQPLDQIGRRAVESVVAQAFQGATAADVVLNAQLVKRGSSVALKEELAEPHPNDRREDIVDSDAFKRAFHESSGELRSRLEECLGGSPLAETWSSELTGALVAELCGRRAGLLQRAGFLDCYEHMMLTIVEAGADLTGCREVLEVLRNDVIPLVGSVASLRHRAEALFFEAGLLWGNIAERLQVQLRLRNQSWRQRVQSVGASLLQTTTTEGLRQAVVREFASIGIHSMLLCTFEGNENAALRVAYGDGASVPVDPTPFPRDQLLPAPYSNDERRRARVTVCIYLADQALGYVMFDLGPTDPELYELMRDYLTGVLKGMTR